MAKVKHLVQGSRPERYHWFLRLYCGCEVQRPIKWRLVQGERSMDRTPGWVYHEHKN